MTRNSVILSCSLMCLLVLAAPTTAQRQGLMGTPPPTGHTIEEVVVIETIDYFEVIEVNQGERASFDVDLPLPVFPSSGRPAEPSQCMWGFDHYSTIAASDTTYLEMAHAVQLSGESKATCYVDLNWGLTPGTVTICYKIHVIAIRTTPPVPVQSKSFGEIKAMFQEE